MGSSLQRHGMRREESRVDVIEGRADRSQLAKVWNRFFIGHNFLQSGWSGHIKSKILIIAE